MGAAWPAAVDIALVAVPVAVAARRCSAALMVADVARTLRFRGAALARAAGRAIRPAAIDVALVFVRDSIAAAGAAAVNAARRLLTVSHRGAGATVGAGAGAATAAIDIGLEAVLDPIGAAGRGGRTAPGGAQSGDQELPEASRFAHLRNIYSRFAVAAPSAVAGGRGAARHETATVLRVEFSRRRDAEGKAHGAPELPTHARSALGRNQPLGILVQNPIRVQRRVIFVGARSGGYALLSILTGCPQGECGRLGRRLRWCRWRGTVPGS